jgi:phosphomannomutase
MGPKQDSLKSAADRSLRFGTSGLRDFDANLTDREVFVNTRGFIQYLLDLHDSGRPGGIRRGQAVALAADFRPSSRVDRIPRAVAAAILDAGCEVVFCGQVPTPAVANYGLRHGLASVMVTGSHIPFGSNGIKFNRPDGEILKAEERPILDRVHQVRTRFLLEPGLSWFNADGAFHPRASAPPGLDAILDGANRALSTAESAAGKEYLDRYIQAFGPEALRGVNLAFYRQSAVGRDLLPAILRGLGADVSEYRELNVQAGEFLPVDTEKMTDPIREQLRGIAREHGKLQGRNPFAVLSADGDSDRPVVCDEEGEFIPGDVLGVLASMYLRPGFVAVPITCNSAAVLMLQRFARVVLTQVGSPHINKAMQEAKVANPGVLAAGYEANGGYLTGSDWSIQGRTLPALPTRDAALPMIGALLFMRQGAFPQADGTPASIQRLSDIVRVFPRHTSSAAMNQEHDGIPYPSATVGQAILNHFSPGDPGIEELDLVQGLVIWKPDPTGARRRELMTSAQGSPSMPAARTALDRLGRCFCPERGFGSVARVNYLDGIRITFENGDVVHLRPSGNAPEFRFYTEANTPQRARELGEQRVEIVTEIIRHLQA